MAHLAADLRYAVRSLRKVPLFTAIAVLSMAFGIAANTAVFTLVDQVVLRTLPVARPGELVQVSAPDTESYGGGMGDGTELSYADVSRSQGPQPGLCRHVLPDAERPDGHLRRAQRAGQCRTGFGHVLPPTRRAAGGRTPVQR